MSAPEPPAFLEDVLREQLEFLIAHPAACTVRQCSDCERFKAVRKELMKPFEDELWNARKLRDKFLERFQKNG